MVSQTTRRVIFGVLLVATTGFAQQPPPPVVSPEAKPDRTVTVRLRAPNAQQVTVSGDFGGKPQPLTKGDDDVWTATIGPFEPGVYSYTFNIDGVSAVDQANGKLKTGIRAAASIFEIRGTPPASWDTRDDVVHGAVHIHTYKSKNLGVTRRFWVYTPPDYDRETRSRYPVLYLLHGAGDDESSWVQHGRANAIFDNLIADKKAKPAVVVMPFGHTGPFPNFRSPASRQENIKRFEEDLITSVLPEVEARYRVHRDRLHRGIVGLSMGGGQSLTVGLNRLDLFAWVGGFSSALFKDAASEGFAKLLANPKAANEQLKLLWIGCGKDDRLIEGSQAFADLLKQNDIKHQFHVTPGAHTWHVWRRYLTDFAPLLW